MKRKIIFIALLLFFPLYVNAQCSSTIISGGGSSTLGPGYSGGSGCMTFNGNTCLSSWPNKAGVRFQIYKIEGNSITLIGKGADVWGQAPNDGTFTRPSNNNLYLKTHDCAWPSSLAAAREKRATLSISGSEYRSGKYGNVYVDSGIIRAIKNGWLSTWAFDYYKNKAEPKSGWLKTNFFDPLRKGKFDTVKSIFKMTDSELSEMISDTKNYYVTAEVIYQYIDAHSGAYFHGTVSETGYTHGSGWPNDAIITQPSDPNIKGLVPTLINKVRPTNVAFENYGYHPTSIYTVCNYAYGWEAWNIKEVCWDCGMSCKESCKHTDADTAGRVACAVAWCNGNMPTEAAKCIKECREGTPANIGCTSTEKKCESYRASRTTSSEKTKYCHDYASAKQGDNETLEAEICYDDNGSFGDSNDIDYSVSSYNYQTTKYYKIKCKNKMVFTYLPNNQYIYLDDSKPMTLHFSYQLEYTKKCTLYYRANKNIKSGWTTNLEDSLIEWDLKSLDVAYKEAEKLYKTYTEEKDKKIQKAIMENIVKIREQLENTKKTALSRLRVLVNEPAPEKLKENNLKLRLYDYKTLREVTGGEEIRLIPIICKKNTDEIESERMICLLNTATKETYISYSGDTYTCEGEGGTIIEDGTTYTYTETVIYALPDDYIGAQSDNIGPFYSEEDCKGAVAASNGFCKVIDYSYVLPPFDGSDRISYTNTVKLAKNKVVLTVEGGECDEFKLTYNCNYDFDTDYCEPCKGIADHESEEYKTCINQKCGCDSYCGADQVCRTKYCPELCEGCNWRELKDDDDCDDCEDKCGSVKGNTEKYINCFYDECCYSKCNGDRACIAGCCVSKCNEKYAGDLNAKNNCIKTECDNITTPENNYLFRSITQDNPFPDRGTASKNIGNNWYNKENFIILADEAKSRYYDRTNGINGQYEYSIKINSSQLKKVKEMIKKSKQEIGDVTYYGTTSYKFFNRSTTKFSDKSSKAYCSSFLYDELSTLGIYVKSSEGQTYCH